MSEPGVGLAGDDLAGTVRIGFLDRLRFRLEMARHEKVGVALVIVDCGLVDRADAVWGFEVGDAVRKHISSQLRSEVLRRDDFLASVGRDDIACVLAPIEGAEMAMRAAEKMMRAAGTSLWAADDEVYAQPTIGIALYPEHGDTAERLLRRAKGASRFARALPGRIAMHDDALEAERTAQFLDEHRLRAAIADEKLELLFQPQIELRSDRVMGAEAMLAWPGSAEATRSLSAAQVYVAAESAGMFDALISSFLNRALRNCSEFRYAAGLDLRVALNLSARMLLWEVLPDLVERALRTWALRPSRLVIELSETAVLHDQAQAREALARLKALGVRLAIDDSALAVEALFGLAQLPFQELKIDLGDAPDLASEPKHERIVRALIELAHQLRLDVCATNVSTPELAKHLTALNCDYAQGTYKGPAVAAGRFVERYGYDFG
ncbi:MAG: GGDEF domain-containing phosphodiesterase [Burkholderiales bacterium]|nr:GGDEF domain-containing phosphodiesterase [Burkholderiales bacterium]